LQGAPRELKSLEQRLFKSDEIVAGTKGMGESQRRGE
jgi:hypothetical protein